MTKIKRLKVLFLSMILTVVAVFCGFSLAACNDGNDSGGTGGGESGKPEAPAPLALTTSVETSEVGENTYTINAVVHPETLTPRWVITWENPDSEWAAGKNTADYFNLELSNNDKTATLSTKQAFGETALLTATISSPTGEVSVSKKVEYSLMSCTFELSDDGSSYIVTGDTGVYTMSSAKLVIPSVYNEKPVTTIKKYAFSNCTSLSSVEIPFSVTTIEPHAFSNCTSLSSVEIPSSVTEIYAGVFNGCTSLTSVKMPDSFENFGDGMFNGCTSLTNVTVPFVDFLSGAIHFLCDGCTSLVNVTISPSVTDLGIYAFRNCTSLKSIVIPASVTSIPTHTFAGCTSLVNVTFLGDKSKIDIDDSAFEGCPYQP